MARVRFWRDSISQVRELTEIDKQKPVPRVLIVDDEVLARQRLRRYLVSYGAFEIDVAESGLQAVELIRSFRPQVVFLDIEMPGLNGFEVLAQFSERPFQVVFQTAFDEFAIRAFDEHAADYLLKPFTRDRFERSLDRVLSLATDEARLRALEATIRSRDGFLRRLSVRQGNALRIVEEAEITCFLSRDHYTCVYLADGREAICELSLANLVTRLDPSKFRALHRNNIVRITEIRAMSVSRSEGMVVEMSNGMKLQVSRSHRQALRQLIKGATSRES